MIVHLLKPSKNDSKVHTRESWKKFIADFKPTLNQKQESLVFWDDWFHASDFVTVTTTTTCLQNGK